MAVLGIDYGAKKIGLAKSDEEQKFALPLEILYNSGKTEVLDHLKNICQQYNIKTIVIGVPVSLHQGEKKTFWRQKDLQNKQMKEVLGFVNWLKDNINLPIEIEDERLTTKMANGLRKDLVKKGHDDAVAAMLILQSYLDKVNL
ncbi:MAG: Holliday junction resolvase RuvX [Parcubacteria group bacterium]|jgi:putative Holliday junction resolvase|nr:Holliday junction resolvase RuvX [Parcubacteria group bacterium]|tara:strand:- start:13247 stop:13678 length:432 start_codon:yes stop_codon:yes gene_type:complete